MTSEERPEDGAHVGEFYASMTYRFEDAAEQRNRVYRHVGRLTSSAAGIDEHMTMLLAHLVAPADPRVAARVFGTVNFAVKKKFLKAALDNEWPDKKPLLHWIDEIESHRNTLAHRSVHTSFGLTEHTIRTILRGGDTDMTPVDVGTFDAWESRADTVYITLASLNALPALNLPEISLRAVALQAIGPEPTTTQLAALNEIFPPDVRPSSV